jgi:hypothetical protein
VLPPEPDFEFRISQFHDPGRFVTIRAKNFHDKGSWICGRPGT